MSSVRKIKPKFDPDQIRNDFPILKRKIRDKDLVYLDNGASTQKPNCVIENLNQFYKDEYANIHRGVHWLSQLATKLYEESRKTVKDFINANSSEEIIFTRGTTESINLISSSYGRNFLKAGDEILISAMEHHSNIVPWQILCEQIGTKLIVAPMNHDGEIIQEEYEKLLSEKTKIVSLVHISNALGTINPIKDMIKKAKEVGAITIIDGAQAVAHEKVDVKDLDCDFYAFSGHKLFGPTGIGILFGKKDLLNKMPPYQGGGDMISYVSFEKTTYNELPYKFEAGTPHIAGAIGLGKAIEYLNQFDWHDIEAHEKKLLHYTHEKLLNIDGLKIIGNAKAKASVVSFIIDGIHPHDMGTILDQEGIAIRAGHHCAQPVMDFYGIPATTRASFTLYNNLEDIDRLVSGIEEAIKIFRG